MVAITTFFMSFYLVSITYFGYILLIYFLISVSALFGNKNKKIIAITLMIILMTESVMMKLCNALNPSQIILSWVGFPCQTDPIVKTHIKSKIIKPTFRIISMNLTLSSPMFFSMKYESNPKAKFQSGLFKQLNVAKIVMAKNHHSAITFGIAWRVWESIIQTKILFKL